MDEFGKIGEYPYLAIIGDIQSSRNTSNRVRLQKDLEHALGKVNRSIGNNLASNFLMTLGDEFQGLLSSPLDFMDVLISLDETLSFTSVRYGAGWGPLTTELKRQAIGMDGPCFHNARAALNLSKEGKRSVTVIGFGEKEDYIINAVLGLIAALRTGWTKKQADIVSRVRRAKTQKEVAIDLGVNPSVISEALSATHFNQLLEAEGAITSIIDIFLSKTGIG